MWHSLESSGLTAQCQRVIGREATKEELKLAHSEDHIDAVNQRDAMMDESTYFTDGTPLAARLAAGCVLEMTRQVCLGEARNGFCVVRPPGHHARRSNAMGFCIFNNVAVAARNAQKHWGVKKVAIFDWDVHHGNGIQDIFYDDPSVLYVSIHRGGFDQSFFYPGTGTADRQGAGAGQGFTVNIPLEGDWGPVGDATYRVAFERVVMPVLQAFQPDLVLVSAGFDAAKGDPLGGFSLSPGLFGHMTRRLAGLAPAGRLVLALEGGYNVGVTAACGVECVRGLLGEAETAEPTSVEACWAQVPEGERALLCKALDRHRCFWPHLPARLP